MDGDNFRKARSWLDVHVRKALTPNAEGDHPAVLPSALQELQQRQALQRRFDAEKQLQKPQPQDLLRQLEVEKQRAGRR